MERLQIKISREEAFEFLGSEGFLQIDKRLIKLFKPNVALFLSNLIQYSQGADWFYCTHEKQMEHLNLTETEIRTCKKFLIERKILRTKLMGIPCKEYYYIDLIILGKELLKYQKNGKV